MTHKTILIVEDESLVARDIEQSLKRMKYNVLAVIDSAEKALSFIRENTPDLVLMDIKLKGGMDGITAAERMRDENIPVIFLTAHSDNNTLERAKLSEPYGYIIKPFEDNELHTAVEMALYKHKMEMKLRESERWLSTTLHSIGDAVIATDHDGRVVLMNKVAEDLTGWSEADATGSDVGDVFCISSELTGTILENPVSRVLREGCVVSLANNTLLKSKSGKITPIDDSGAPIVDADNQIVGVVLVFRDIGERRKREQALIESEMRFRSVVESVKEGIILTDDRGTVKQWNMSVERIFQKSSSDIGESSVESFFPSRFAETYRKNVKKAIKSLRDNRENEGETPSVTFETTGLKGNNEFFIEVLLSAWKYGEHVFLTHLMRDISLQKQIEREKEMLILELQESLSRMQSLSIRDELGRQ